MFLTPDQIKALTERTQHRAQAAMLRSLGITHKIRSDGSILVLTAHVEKELGWTAPAKEKESSFQPDWAAANA